MLCPIQIGESAGADKFGSERQSDREIGEFGPAAIAHWFDDSQE